mgnify:CR=1 FL=1
MADYKLKYSGEEIDAILEKAKEADPLEDLADIRKGAALGKTAAQYINEADGEYLGNVNGIIAPNDEHYYLPGHGPEEDKAHTFAMVADVNNAIASAITTTLNTEV